MSSRKRTRNGPLPPRLPWCPCGFILAFFLAYEAYGLPHFLSDPTRPVTFRVFPKRKGRYIASSFICSGAGPQAGIASSPPPNICWKSHPSQPRSLPCPPLLCSGTALCPSTPAIIYLLSIYFGAFIFHLGTILENIAGIASWYSLWLATLRVAIYSDTQQRPKPGRRV